MHTISGAGGTRNSNSRNSCVCWKQTEIRLTPSLELSVREMKPAASQPASRLVRMRVTMMFEEHSKPLTGPSLRQRRKANSCTVAEWEPPRGSWSWGDEAQVGYLNAFSSTCILRISINSFSLQQNAVWSSIVYLPSHEQTNLPIMLCTYMYVYIPYTILLA